MPGESWTEIETPQPGGETFNPYTSEGQTENPYAAELAAEAIKTRDQLSKNKEKSQDEKTKDLKDRINLEIYE